MKLILNILVISLITIGCTKKPTGKVYFTEPQNGAEVKSPVSFKMVVEGMEVVPAGEVLEGKGHHHILINEPPIPFGKPVPFIEKKTYHYGKGQTEAQIQLEPGEYDIVLQFANGAHVSYGEELSSKIHIKVAE